MIIRCRFIPKGICLNLFGTLWTRDPSRIDRYVINHERIHTAQQRELLFLPFYLLYIFEWLFRLIQYRNPDLAYRNISFEREAYVNDSNLAYLPSRKFMAWTTYLRHHL